MNIKKESAEEQKSRDIALAMGGAIETAIVPYHIARLRAANPEISVHAAVSQGALQFVTETTLRGMTGQTIYSPMSKFEIDGVPSHLANAKRDALVIYPATARIIAEMALGIISCPVTRLFAFTKKRNVIVTPYIHPDMSSELYVSHLQKLVKLGCTVVSPQNGLFWVSQSAWVKTGEAVRAFLNLEPSVETINTLRFSN